MNSSARPTLELATLLHAAYAAEAEVEAKLAGIGLSMAKLLALKALSAAGDSMRGQHLSFMYVSCIGQLDEVM